MNPTKNVALGKAYVRPAPAFKINNIMYTGMKPTETLDKENGKSPLFLPTIFI